MVWRRQREGGWIVLPWAGRVMQQSPANLNNALEDMFSNLGGFSAGIHFRLSTYCHMYVKNKLSVQWNSCFAVHTSAGNKNKYKKNTIWKNNKYKNTKTEQNRVFAIYTCKLCRLVCANVQWWGRRCLIPVSCSGVWWQRTRKSFLAWRFCISHFCTSGLKVEVWTVNTTCCGWVGGFTLKMHFPFWPPCHCIRT